MAAGGGARAARDEGKPTLTDAEVSDFVDRFMPAYRAYLPRLYRDGPAENGWGEALVVEVDASRRVVGGGERGARNATTRLFGTRARSRDA